MAFRTVTWEFSCSLSDFCWYAVKQFFQIIGNGSHDPTFVCHLDTLRIYLAHPCKIAQRTSYRFYGTLS
jgi:hypothetical protein